MQKKHTLATIACSILALQVPVPTLAGSTDDWQGKATSHFAIYTPSGSNDGSEILSRLEVARTFFERTSFFASVQTPQLNIMAIGSLKDAEVYRVNPSAYAFYQRTREGDYVVMRDLEPEHVPVAVHEYTHFVMEHAGLKLPLWLNEGLADFYSTLEARKGQVMVGVAPGGRVSTLSGRRWMDWTTLTSVDHDSPYYRQTDKMLLFYAQSWALVHMLNLDAKYESGFAQFLATVSAGASTEAAMKAVYHRSLEQVGSDLETYVRSRRMDGRLLNVDVRLAGVESSEIGDAGKRVDLAIAEILAATPQLTQEANSRLSALAVKYPEDPRPEESMGFAAMRAGQQKDAEEYFARAARKHTQNPDVWFRLAHLKLQQEGPTPEVLDLLERVIAADNGNYNARVELGFAAAKNQKYELAVKALTGIDNVKPEHAYVVAYTLAYCFVSIHQGNQARAYAEQARKIAGNNKDKDEVNGLLRYIQQASPLEVASR